GTLPSPHLRDPLRGMRNRSIVCRTIPKHPERASQGHGAEYLWDAAKRDMNPYDKFSMDPWKNVLVPLDSSEGSASILDQARPLLERESLAVTFLRVIDCSESHARDPAYLTDPRHWK